MQMIESQDLSFIGNLFTDASAKRVPTCTVVSDGLIICDGQIRFVDCRMPSPMFAGNRIA